MRGRKHFGWYDECDSPWRFRRAHHRMEQEVAARLGLPSGALVLDAGCGMGQVARTLAVSHGWRVEGIDILDGELEHATRRSRVEGLEGRTRFRWGSYQEIPFEDAHFDGVYTTETLSHSADFRRALRELHRVLKPGGRVVLAEYSRTPAGELSDAANEALDRVCTMAAMPAWLELEHGLLEQELYAAGFVDVVTEDVTEKMMPMLRVFAAAGRFPYWVGRVTGHPEKAVNAMSGVELYRHAEAWAYRIYSFARPA